MLFWFLFLIAANVRLKIVLIVFSHTYLPDGRQERS